MESTTLDKTIGYDSKLFILTKQNQKKKKRKMLVQVCNFRTTHSRPLDMNKAKKLT